MLRLSRLVNPGYSRWCGGVRAISTAARAITNKYNAPADLLKDFRRSADSKLKVSEWDELWKMRGVDMKAAGLSVKDRRYILWALHKVKQGEEPSQFAHEPMPKKTVRGWGPRVQNGKIIKSRRKRMRKA